MIRLLIERRRVSGITRVVSLAVFMVAVQVATAHAQLITADPPSVDFGLRRVNPPSPYQTSVALTASGKATGVSCTVIQPASTGFSIPGCVSTIDNETIYLTVSFDPTSLGTKSATLRVTYNPSGQLDIPLTGTVPALWLTPDSHTFADTPVNSTDGPATFTVRNDDSSSHNITSITTSGVGCANEFTNSGTTSGSVGAGGTVTFTVTFKPESVGVHSCDYTVHYDSTYSTNTVSADGEGIAGDISLDTTSPYNFGSHDANTTTNKTVRISNVGTAGLTVSGIELDTAAGCAHFNLTGVPVSETLIAIGGHLDFTVQFIPLNFGNFTCDVTITSDDPDEPSRVLTVQGQGLAGDITFTPASPYTFSDLDLGASELQDIAIGNGGNAPLTVSLISKPSSTACDQFHITSGSPPDKDIDPGNTDSFTVEFAPTVYGLSECTITVESTDPDGNASYVVRGTGRAPDISLSETSYTFPDHIIGVTTPANTRTVTINNVGSGPLGLITITGSGCGQFALTDNPAPGTISAGGHDTFTVRFQPTVAGNYTCVYTVTSNDPDEPTVTWTASGHALDPASMTVTPGTAMAFGSVLVNSSANDTFTISNASGTHRANLVGTVSRSGTNPLQFQVSPSTFNIAPGSSATITVTFHPTSMGPKNAQIDVTNTTDPNNPSDSFAVSGTGIDRIITVTDPPAGIDFGDVLVGTGSPPTDTITIQNDGNSDLTISAVEIVGTNPLDFHITAGPISDPGNSGDDFTVAGSATQTWTVNCVPTAVGTRNGTFRITSNATNQPQTTVSLTCHGTEPELVITPSTIAFPGTFVCDEASVLTVTLRNNGTAPLTLGSLSSSSSVFTVTTPPADTNLSPSESTTFGITFDPTAVTTYDETLTINWTPSGPSQAPLSGAGLSKDLVAAPGTYDFTGVNTCESAVSHTFTITNNGTGPFRIMSVVVDNVSDFTVVEVDSLPTASLAHGESMEFQVDAMPQALGSATGTITVTTDIPSLCGSTAQIPISATGVSPGASFAPADVDFGPRDVQGGPVTQSLTITNSGGEDLQVSDVVLDGDSEFSLAAGQLTAFTVAPGASADIDVVYQSTSVSENTATLTITSDAECGDVSIIDLLGRGIDREIDLSTYSLDFPDTYRNTATPSTQSFTIGNLGEADLNISLVETTGAGEAAFTFAEDVPSVIAGGATETVTVEFTPTSAGEFLAEITLDSDDSDEGVAHISLSGVGRVPNIDAPVDIDLGRVGVGVPVRVTDLVASGIQFSNMESDDFTLAALRIADVQRDGTPAESSLFAVSGAQAGSTLAAGDTVSVDVEFTPDQVGSYEATLEVYLDEDPVRVTFVTIRAQAVNVRVRSGGGCSAASTGGDAGSALLVLILVGFVGLCLRRRATRARVLIALVAIAGTSAVAGSAYADVSRDLDLSVFRPMPGADPELLSLESPRVGLPGSWSLGVFFDHSVDPLTLNQVDSTVGARSAGEIAFSYTIRDRYEAGLLIPVVSQSGEASTVIGGVAPADGTSFGDLALHGKASLAEKGPLGLAASATVTLPTASDGEFAGESGPTAHARGIAGYRNGVLLVACNAGVRLRGKNEFGDASQGSELTYGVATSYRFARKMQAVAELYGALGIAGGGPATRPLELAAGVRYRATRELGLVVGAGGGLSSGIGTATARGFFLLSYTRKARDLPAVLISHEPGEAKVDRGDNDADGVLNQYDRCPDEAEDMDDFEDEDGCPDPDNDGDGLADADDPCPDKAEDKDGYKDGDGCPDLDNDGDGIEDSIDKCPDEPEDKDGFEDRDGCDDPDNDKDGIPDVIDQCALEPETINGKQDDDGCPDPGDSLVMVMPDRIEVFEPVRFDGNSARITRKSRNVLGQVAATMRANRDFVMVRIAVHVQPRNANDKKLTTLRAEAVRKWLVDWGVEPERLEAKGYGSERPLVPPKSKDAKKVNDRVEFVIVEKRVKK